MKTLALVVLIFAALRQGGSTPKPARELDPNDPKSVSEYAAYNTRIQRSYETKFKARLTPPQGDALEYVGRCVWVSPGILYIHYTASGGYDKNIVRVANQVWVYDSLVGWATSEEAGMPGAGRGVQNPDEVLSVLAQHAGAAKLKQPGLAEMTFAGEDIEKIMKEQAQQGAFDWKRSSARVELHVDAETRLKKFACEATLQPNDPNVKGVVKYAAEVEAVSYNAATELKFQDEQKKEIKLSAEIRKAIETFLKEKK